MDNKKMKILFTVGFLSLLHAAYSAAQRNFLAYPLDWMFPYIFFRCPQIGRIFV